MGVVGRKALRTQDLTTLCYPYTIHHHTVTPSQPRRISRLHYGSEHDLRGDLQVLRVVVEIRHGAAQRAVDEALHGTPIFAEMHPREAQHRNHLEQGCMSSTALQLAPRRVLGHEVMPRVVSHRVGHRSALVLQLDEVECSAVREDR